jgi:2-polyprenyl-3-methyl-5-hydroxy-6-metoxy-1,4-benzoquinol methylase
MRCIAHALDRTWTAWQCLACGAYPVEERIQYPAIAYDANYFQRRPSPTDSTYSGYVAYQHDESLMMKDFRERLQPWIQPTMHILDIGCATGVGLAAAHTAGVPEVNLVGVDISSYAVHQATQRLPQARFIEGDACIVEIGSGYDLVLAWDVFEHVNSPTVLCTRLIKSLVKGGKLVIYTPNPESMIRKIMGPRWIEFRPGEHQCFVGRRWCKQIAGQTGCRILTMKSLGKRVTIEHASRRLRAYLPWFPLLTSQRAMKMSGGDHLFVVFERTV